MTSPIISFQDFGFQYDAQAEPTLHHINLDVYPGQKILIAGASGSGKSTVASCINGLIPHAYPGKITGKVLVDGKDVTQSSVFDLSHTVGTVLQDTDGQFIGLTVAEDIAFALENDCVPQDDMKKTVQRVAQLVDIEHHLDHAPYELSGGQKQRVSLAGVMVDDVKILLFDEPLANLDPAAGRATIELIDEIQEKTGAAVLIIEHRLEDVLWRHVDRVVLMQDGAIVADLPPGELLCGNFLMERGIREPLYLTALRYALVPVTPEICPEHPDTLKLTDAQKQQVKNWVLEQQEEVKEQQPGTELLKVEHLSFSYGEGRKNLEDISFTIYPGEMVSIVGKNGAGKSKPGGNLQLDDLCPGNGVGQQFDSLIGRVDGLSAERVKTGDKDLHEGNLRVLFSAHGKTKHSAAGAADDVHKVGYIVLHEQNIIYLLAQVECTDKDQSDRNTAVPAAGQAGQHDEHKYNAGGTQQGGCASFV